MKKYFSGVNSLLEQSLVLAKFLLHLEKQKQKENAAAWSNQLIHILWEQITWGAGRAGGGGRGGRRGVKIKNGSGGKLLKAEGGHSWGEVKFLERGKYISLHTQNCCCLIVIVITFQEEWSFSTFSQGLSEHSACGMFFEFCSSLTNKTNSPSSLNLFKRCSLQRVDSISDSLMI